MAYLTLTPNELYRPGQLFVVRESPVPGLRDVDLVVRVIERWQWVHRSGRSFLRASAHVARDIELQTSAHHLCSQRGVRRQSCRAIQLTVDFEASSCQTEWEGDQRRFRYCQYPLGASPRRSTRKAID